MKLQLRSDCEGNNKLVLYFGRDRVDLGKLLEDAVYAALRRLYDETIEQESKELQLEMPT